ncbi:BfmA/BtgA family mobilization protein [Pedobacter cryoconitis]|uniref:BfmA/BtgA family mobilization protein n=1 Tax=Pedobacter cryoconitis TaxID=188932 RepID=UPI00161AFBCB|nr:BfmA/BtgA family mobilization protein [Pedobacter cryoconitis]MBB5645902.1 putative DNA-binding protein [Pedobacter cryoconitis]
MEDMNTKSVRYPVATDQKLEKIALKLGRTKKLVVVQMVDYFYRSKKDPLDLGDELLKKELVSGNSRIIAFFKTQESDFLLPILTASGILTAIAKQHSIYFKAISAYLAEEAKKTVQLSSHVNAINKGIARIQAQMDEKALLKVRFKKIIEHYITQRESLGWPVSSVKKEELQTNLWRSLENL